MCDIPLCIYIVHRYEYEGIFTEYEMYVKLILA